MSTLTFKPLPKQFVAWQLLSDDLTTELLYGGAAGGGKSYLGCVWQIIRRIAYPGTRGLIGRSKLKTLKKTTLQTFFEAAKNLGLTAKSHFEYNQMMSSITFYNGSLIYLQDLFYYPSDPEFDSLGSLEITDAFVDEASEIKEKAFNILNSRERFKLDNFKLMPKTLLTCNPHKGWLYSRFYKPFKNKTLPVNSKFIQSLHSDNPYLSKHYIENLKRLDPITYRRLYCGDWEYADEDNSLFKYDALNDLFTNKAAESTDKYVTCDAARLGKDTTVIMFWQGFQVKKIWIFSKLKTTEVEDELKKILSTYQVPRSHCIVDEIGLGSGIVDHLECKGFVAGAAPIATQLANDPNSVKFANLKTQCFYKLSELVNKAEIGIDCDDINIKQKIIEELEIIKQLDSDEDGKLKITSKDDMKNILGRSPDLADALSFRCFFELKPTIQFTMTNV